MDAIRRSGHGRKLQTIAQARHRYDALDLVYGSISQHEMITRQNGTAPGPNGQPESLSPWFRRYGGCRIWYRIVYGGSATHSYFRSRTRSVIIILANLLVISAQRLVSQPPRSSSDSLIDIAWSGHGSPLSLTYRALLDFGFLGT